METSEDCCVQFLSLLIIGNLVLKKNLSIFRGFAALSSEKEGCGGGVCVGGVVLIHLKCCDIGL